MSELPIHLDGQFFCRTFIIPAHGNYDQDRSVRLWFRCCLPYDIFSIIHIRVDARRAQSIESYCLWDHAQNI